MKTPRSAEGPPSPWVSQSDFQGVSHGLAAHPQPCSGNYRGPCLPRAPGWSSELNQPPEARAWPAQGGGERSQPSTWASRGALEVGPGPQPTCSPGLCHSSASRGALHTGQDPEGGAFSLSFIEFLTRNIWKYMGPSWMPQDEAPAQPGRAFAGRARVTGLFPAASSARWPCLPPSLFPPFFSSREHSTLSSSGWLNFLPCTWDALCPELSEVLQGGLFPGEQKAWPHLPDGHHPVTSHRNPKLRISESALSPVSSQVLAFGHGTALCPGVLPDPWTSAPTAWPLLHRLAAWAQVTPPLA